MKHINNSEKQTEENYMIRADKRKYHFIYKTTCVITNRYYIGMHSTENIEDGYLGSGKRLWYSIRKHGRENHICEILEFLPSRKELSLREKEIVNEELLSNDLCMNLNLGGNGGFAHINSNKDEVYLKIRSENGKLTGGKNSSILLKKCWLEKYESMLNICSIGGKIGGKITGPQNVKSMNTPETNEKRKEKYKKIGHQQGEKNSRFGTCWIYHELIGSKTCKKELLPEYLEQGWFKGRKMIYGVSI